MLKESTNNIRKARHSETQEDFTPEFLLEELANTFFSDEYKCQSKTFLDNSCGNGNILLYIIKKKLDNGSTYIEALNTVYGIDLMADNIKECHNRIKALLDEKDIKYNKSEVNKILKHNIVCHDALDWDYRNWKPKNKKIKRKKLF